MNRLIILAIWACSATVCGAQQLTSPTFSSLSFLSDGPPLSYTVGEFVVSDQQSEEGLRLTAGFHQPFLGPTTSNLVWDRRVIDVFPNPAKEGIHIVLPEEGIWTAELYNLLGQRLQVKEGLQKRSFIKFSNWSSSHLLLRLIEEDQGAYQVLKLERIN